MKGSFNSMEQSAAISEHLTTVEIKCEVIDERVFKVLKFLCTFNIWVSAADWEVQEKLGCPWVGSLTVQKCTANVRRDKVAVICLSGA
ncbi:hypothetical protein ACP70R_004224 [Stipagrostis hirtigluma subsp. patula]